MLDPMNAPPWVLYTMAGTGLAGLLGLRIKYRRPKAAPLTVVETVQQQTDEARALAAITGQNRLADPRLNPATRSHADSLRTTEQLQALDHEHARRLRRLRVEDRRAADAEEALDAIALAQRTASPARSVLALHRGKRKYLRLALAGSLTLSAGSAMGVEAAATTLGAPTGTGYIAEVACTIMTTVAIMYRAHLAEHRGHLPTGSWQRRTLWALIIVPLLASFSANVLSLNIVGGLCAVGAVAFSTFGYLVADRSAAAMQARADEVTRADEEELRRIAVGDDLFTPVTADAHDQVHDQAHGGAGSDDVADRRTGGPDRTGAERICCGPAGPVGTVPVRVRTADGRSRTLFPVPAEEPPSATVSSLRDRMRQAQADRRYGVRSPDRIPDGSGVGGPGSAVSFTVPVPVPGLAAVRSGAGRPEFHGLAVGSRSGPLTEPVPEPVAARQVPAQRPEPVLPGAVPDQSATDRGGVRSEVPDSPQGSDRSAPGPVNGSTGTRTGRSGTGGREKADPLARIGEAIDADDAYRALHGRPIPAEKLRAQLRISKPAANALTQEVRRLHQTAQAATPT